MMPQICVAFFGGTFGVFIVSFNGVIVIFLGMIAEVLFAGIIIAG
jgi:hypothetical protein